MFLHQEWPSLQTFFGGGEDENLIGFVSMVAMALQSDALSNICGEGNWYTLQAAFSAHGTFSLRQIIDR